jgi:hypothetical protein
MKILAALLARKAVVTVIGLAVCGAFLVSAIRTWERNHLRYRQFSKGREVLAATHGALKARHARTGVWRTDTVFDDADLTGIAPFLVVRMASPPGDPTWRTTVTEANDRMIAIRTVSELGSIDLIDDGQCRFVNSRYQSEEAPVRGGVDRE